MASAMMKPGRRHRSRLAPLALYVLALMRSTEAFALHSSRAIGQEPVLARTSLRLCSSPNARQVAPPMPVPSKTPPDGASKEAADPIYDDVWLQRETPQFASVGESLPYCASYLPFTVNQSHTRAILVLDACDNQQQGGEDEDVQALRCLTDQIALSCECVALLSRVRGAPSSSLHKPLLREANAASLYLNRVYRAQALGIVASRNAAPALLELLASGALEAHALVALCPFSGTSGSTQRSTRELTTPLLALVGTAEPKLANLVAEYNDGLSLNSRLGSDYFVAPFSGCSRDFVLAPKAAFEEKEADRATSLAIAWFDRYVPEGVVPS